MTERINQVTQKVIGAAIEVHKHLGPGLLESAYEECMCHELTLRGIAFDRQMPLPVRYKGMKLDCGYRLDIVVQNMLILELKACEKIEPGFAIDLVDLIEQNRRHSSVMLRILRLRID